MNAKTREQYVRAWRNHVRELHYVVGDAGIPWSEWAQMKDQLEAMIEKAASANFPVQA